MKVATFTVAKWCAFAGMDPESPTCIGLAFDASKVSPMPTNSVPFLTVTVSAVGWKCGGILYPAGMASSIVDRPALAGSPLTTAILAPVGKTPGAGPQWRAFGCAVGAVWA